MDRKGLFDDRAVQCRKIFSGEKIHIEEERAGGTFCVFQQNPLVQYKPLHGGILFGLPHIGGSLAGSGEQ
ncbi:hypothetical protein HDR62_03950 [bacterium]|nr:hypothetical protein [bacterium]